MADPIIDLFALFGPIPPRGAEPGVGPLLAAHARHGIAGAVVVSTRGIYHSAPAGNRETAALCAEGQGRLLPAAVLDPRLPRRDVGSLAGARLLCLFPVTQQWPIAYMPLVAALSELRQQGVMPPLLVEVSRSGDGTALRRALDQAGYTAPVILAGLDGDSVAEAIALADDSDRIGVCTDGLNGVGEITLAVDLVGEDRVYFGSGAIARHSLAASLAVVRHAAISETARGKVLGGNARRLLAPGGGG